jgi:hypothetical protein
MSARTQVVETIQRFAYDAVTKASIPDDVTLEEQAEGLIAVAMSLLRRDGQPGAADKGRAMIAKYSG